jgi:catecholate siderophore receptor
VTKGPSSAIAGRGSTGGTINQVSKLPSLQSGYLGTVTFGNADYKRTTLDVNRALSSDAIPGIAVRLNAMWTDNDVPRRNEVRAERWGVAPSIAFGLGTAKRATLSYLHLGQDNLPEYGLPWVPANSNPDLQAYANDRPPVDQSNFYGLTTRDYERTDTDIATLQLEYDASRAFSLRNTTRYGVNSRDSVITAPRFASVETSTAINRQLQSRDMDDSIVANYTNVVSRFETGGLRHALAAGLEVSAETSENHAPVGAAGSAGRPVSSESIGSVPRTDHPNRRLHGGHREFGGHVCVRHRGAWTALGSSPEACGGSGSISTTNRSRSPAR